MDERVSRGWVCVSIGGHVWNGLGVGVCVWAMGEGSVGMGVWECLDPYMKGFELIPKVSLTHIVETWVKLGNVSGPMGYKMTQTKLPMGEK